MVQAHQRVPAAAGGEALLDVVETFVGCAATGAAQQFQGEECVPAPIRVLDDATIDRIAAGEVAGFLAPLPVSRLPGVGAKTAAKLADLSVHTAGEVVALGRAALEEQLGNHGLAILGYAQILLRSRDLASAHQHAVETI